MTISSLNDVTSFKWATVRGTSPLSIQLDGDAAVLALIPDSLVDPRLLSVGDRVRVELSLRKCVVHGVSQGTTSPSPHMAGEIKMVAFPNAPEGWLLCQGQSLVRSQYPELFAAIGTTYGAADSTRFSLPDLRGRVAVGRDAGQVEFDVLGEKGGAKTHTLAESEIPSHKHDLTYNNNPLANGLTGATAAGAFVNWFLGNNALAAAPANSVQVGSAGGGQAHNNLQPYITLNYIIKI